VAHTKLIEQTRLLASLPPHHRRLRAEIILGISEITVRRRSQAFFDSIDPLQTKTPNQDVEKSRLN
jgi:hypothetical protein